MTMALSQSCTDRFKFGMAGIRCSALVRMNSMYVTALVVVLLGFIQVEGAPFPAPKINDCFSWDGCCFPKSNVAPIPFTFPTQLPMRTRRAAHLVSDAYIAKYRKAYELMKKLPKTDPRSLENQAKLHCAYCGAAFTFPRSNYGLEIHDGWFFFPWHRAFLYFHERILADLIGDNTFTLPFWNWDNQAQTAPQPKVGTANSMPSYYATPKDKSNSLWNPNRNPCALPPNIIDLNSGGCSFESPRTVRTENHRLMANQMRTATTPELFFGSKYRFGWSGGMGGGNLEGSPHGTVHVLTGNPNAKNPGDDMGNLDRAARDPLFYAHHANLDRLWQVWKTSKFGGGNRVDIRDKDYTQSQFVFYDEKKRLVSIKVEQVLDLAKLRYNYQQVDNPWMGSSSSVSSTTMFPMSTSMPPVTKCAPSNQDAIAVIKKAPLLKKKTTTVFSTKPLTFRVRRADPSGMSEEVLAFKKLSIDWTKTATINAFLFYPGARGSSIDCMEFFGTFSHIPEANHRKKGQYTRSWKLGLNAKLQQLGLLDVSHVVVTLVQVGSSQEIQFGSCEVSK